MSGTARIVFGLCGLIGGTVALVGAFIVWRTGKRELEAARSRLDLLKPR